MRQVNVDKMSLKDLMELELKVQKAMAIARERERAELKAKVEEMVADAGFQVSDLFNAGRGSPKGRAVAPKYVNPDNAAETWSGRGRKPKWLVKKLNEGSSIDDFLI